MLKSLSNKIKLVTHLLLFTISLVLTSTFLGSLVYRKSLLGAGLLALFGICLELCKLNESVWIKTNFKKVKLVQRIARLLVLSFTIIISTLASIFSVLTVIGSEIILSAESSSEVSQTELQLKNESRKTNEYLIDAIEFKRTEITRINSRVSDLRQFVIATQDSLRDEQLNEEVDSEQVAIYRDLITADSAVIQQLEADLSVLRSDISVLQMEYDDSISEIDILTEVSVDASEDFGNAPFAISLVASRIPGVTPFMLITILLASFVIALEILLIFTAGKILPDKKLLYPVKGVAKKSRSIKQTFYQFARNILKAREGDGDKTKIGNKEFIIAHMGDIPVDYIHACLFISTHLYIGKKLFLTLKDNDYYLFSTNGRLVLNAIKNIDDTIYNTIYMQFRDLNI